jgi:hypothetical protein
MQRYYIKHAYTENTITPKYPLSITVSEFISRVQATSLELLNLNGNYYNIEVVECGQEIPNVKPEDAPCMIHENITMYEKYGEKLKYMSFYVREGGSGW